MKEKNKSKNESGVSGFRFLGLAGLVFLGICMEGFYAFLAEPAIYGVQLEAFSTKQSICHWIITCCTWLVFAGYAIHLCKKKCNYDLFEKRKQIALWKWCVIAVIAAFALLYSYYSWGGFKIAKELANLGVLKFSFQYMYYMVETIMFMLIIIFGQLAFERWFHKESIPYGGIIVALTWGLGHCFTKGELEIGIASAILGFCFGSVYLLLNRNIKWSYLVLLLMFIC